MYIIETIHLTAQQNPKQNNLYQMNYHSTANRSVQNLQNKTGLFYWHAKAILQALCWRKEYICIY